MVPIEKELVNALYKPSQWRVTPNPAQHDRRSVYLIAKRNLRLPFLEVFDAPDTLVSCPRRESTTHAPQVLELLNGTFSNREAKVLAARLAAESGRSYRGQIDLAYRLETMGRTGDLSAAAEVLAAAEQEFAPLLAALREYVAK